MKPPTQMLIAWKPPSKIISMAVMKEPAFAEVGMWRRFRNTPAEASFALAAMERKSQRSCENKNLMFGFRFIKVDPTSLVLQYKNGRVVREGAGLSFFCFAPTSSLVLVPVGTVDVPFIFEEVTADFQTVTVQGQLTYRINDAKRLAGMMNFTLSPNGRDYVSDDPLKLPMRLVNHARVLTSASLKALTLREALGQSDSMVASLRDGLAGTEAISALGIEILGLSILAIKPTPETARALEADARETVLRQADEALYARRNSAVELERAIKENELNTEIAVENKKRQIKETQLDAEKSVQGKRREIREAEMAANIALEEKNRELVSLSATNSREVADAKAYAIEATMKAVNGVDPRVIQSLISTGLEPSQLVAMAFRELAENASKIGHLNISPDLLGELLADGKGK